GSASLRGTQRSRRRNNTPAQPPRSVRGTEKLTRRGGQTDGFHPSGNEPGGHHRPLQNIRFERARRGHWSGRDRYQNRDRKTARASPEHRIGTKGRPLVPFPHSLPHPVPPSSTSL